MIGIIGGTGLEKAGLFKQERNSIISTPYGETSSSISFGSINDKPCALLKRHGDKHSIPPTQVNNRANIYALKEIGCNNIIATSACGSLREEIGRGDFVLPDQFIDFTRFRKVSFFEEFPDGDLKHTPMADPFNENIRQAIIRASNNLNMLIHTSATVVSIEGPRFSTRAESNMFRMWGADIINMTTAPETILANEMGIPYAVIALSTDYDCWKTDEEPVCLNDILEIFNKNLERVSELLIETIKNI